MVEEDIQNEINENLEQLKRVEELLNKAQKIHNPTKSEPKIKQNEERVSQPPPPSSKAPSKLPTSSTKSTKKSVFMSAPFKTEPNAIMFKANTKPKTTLVKSSSQKSLIDSNAASQQIEPFNEKKITQVVAKATKPLKETKINQIEFSLKKDGKQLRLPPSTEDLVVKNFRLKQNLLKNRKNEVKSRENFLERLEKCCFKQSSPAFLHYLINKLSFIYDRLKDFLGLISSELLEIDENSEDELNKLKLAKLHCLGEKLKLLDVKLGIQVEAINLQIIKNYTITTSSINIFETKLFKSSNLSRFETEEGEIEATLNYPMSYKNENELKKYFNFKINIIELEFKNLFIKFLDDFYFDSHLKEDENGGFIEKFNLLFGLITDKRSIIVKQ